MENFFCDISSIEKLKNKIAVEFENEKVCFAGDELRFASFLLSLSKTNVIETNISKVSCESVKAVVCPGCEYEKNEILKNTTDKNIFLIFDNVCDLFSFDFLNLKENVNVFLNPKSLLNKKAVFENIFIKDVSCLLISLQDAFFQNLIDNKDSQNIACWFKNILDFMVYLEEIDEINLYNYNYFANFLKKYIEIKSQINTFNLVEKTLFYYGKFSQNNIEEIEASFLISFIINRFLKTKSFIKLNGECFFKKFYNHKKLDPNLKDEQGLINSYLKVKDTDEITEKIKENLCSIMLFNQKIFKTHCFILKKQNNQKTKNISAAHFLKAFSYASDFCQCGVASVMRNLGYLNG